MYCEASIPPLNSSQLFQSELYNSLFFIAIYIYYISDVTYIIYLELLKKYSFYPIKLCRHVSIVINKRRGVKPPKILARSYVKSNDAHEHYFITKADFCILLNRCPCHNHCYLGDQSCSFSRASAGGLRI